MNHYRISLIKSIIRIAGCVISIVLACFWLGAAIGTLGGSLATAEVLGILEEKFDKRKEQ